MILRAENRLLKSLPLLLSHFMKDECGFFPEDNVSSLSFAAGIILNSGSDVPSFEQDPRISDNKSMERILLSIGISLREWLRVIRYRKDVPFIFNGFQ